MGLSVTLACGRGGISAKIITGVCDRPRCHAIVVCTTVEEYREAAAAGWRRLPGNGATCPAHSGATPAQTQGTLDV